MRAAPLLAGEHFAIQTCDRESSDDVVGLRLVRLVDDVAFLLVGQDRRRGSRSIDLVPLQVGPVQLDDGLLDLADMSAASARLDMRRVQARSRLQLGVAEKELALKG